MKGALTAHLQKECLGESDYRPWNTDDITLKPLRGPACSLSLADALSKLAPSTGLTTWLITVQIQCHAPFPPRAFRSATSTVNPLILAFVFGLGSGPIAKTLSKVSRPSQHGRPR